MARLILLIFFVPVGLFSVRAQDFFQSTLLSTPALWEADSNRLSLKVDMVGFFKNNEYFSPVAEGQTLPGTSFALALGYQLADRFKTEMGVYFVSYSGHRPLENLYPFVRLQYAFTPHLNLVMGNLYGGVNHRLIEPLYQWERHFTAKPESGLQMILNTNRWFADVWIDWQHFIQRGDPVHEVLAFGTSVAGRLTGDNSPVSISIPMQLLIHHKGGQINVYDEPGVVLTNAATGISSRFGVDHKWIKSAGLDLYLAGYWNQCSSTAPLPFDRGWGAYSVFRLDASPFKFMAGYWHADQFYAFEGEPLFGSFDPYRPDNRLRIRNLLTCKIVFDKQLFKGVAIGAQVETYSDLNRNKTDYSFGVHLRFNQLFTIKR
jgi:hypothetical protein